MVKNTLSRTFVQISLSIFYSLLNETPEMLIYYFTKIAAAAWGINIVKVIKLRQLIKVLTFFVRVENLATKCMPKTNMKYIFVQMSSLYLLEKATLNSFGNELQFMTCSLWQHAQLRNLKNKMIVYHSGFNISIYYFESFTKCLNTQNLILSLWLSLYI